MMTGTTVEDRILSAVWPVRANKLLAEIACQNLRAVGMPRWSRDEQRLARAVQKEIGLDPVGLSTTIEPLKKATTILGNYRPHALLGFVYIKLKKYENARSEYQKAYDLSKKPKYFEEIKKIDERIRQEELKKKGLAEEVPATES